MISGSTENFGLPGCETNDVDNLKYFFHKYLVSVERGKPNLRLANQLKQIIDTIQIMDASRYMINDGSGKVQRFVIPVGKLDEKEQKSFLEKMREILKSKPKIKIKDVTNSTITINNKRLYE